MQRILSTLNLAFCWNAPHSTTSLMAVLTIAQPIVNNFRTGCLASLWRSLYHSRASSQTQTSINVNCQFIRTVMINVIVLTVSQSVVSSIMSGPESSIALLQLSQVSCSLFGPCVSIAVTKLCQLIHLIMCALSLSFVFSSVGTCLMRSIDSEFHSSSAFSTLIWPMRSVIASRKRTRPTEGSRAPSGRWAATFSKGGIGAAFLVGSLWAQNHGRVSKFGPSGGSSLTSSSSKSSSTPAACFWAWPCLSVFLFFLGLALHFWVFVVVGHHRHWPRIWVTASITWLGQAEVVR